MWKYALRRAVTSVGLLALSSILIFVVLRVIPGDPTITKLGGDQTGVDPAAYAAVRHSLGLDHSLGYQYVHWMEGVVQWNFGKSYFSQFPVTSLIAAAAGPTIELALFALVLGVTFAVIAAILAAVWGNRFVNSGLDSFTAVGMATPAFVTGILLIIAFGSTQGYVSFEHHPLSSLHAALLPAITLAIVVAAPVLRILRSSLTEVSSAPYIRTARGKGLLRRQVVLRHQLPNATIPALTTVGIIIGQLLAGTVIVENVFARPGLGTLLIDSVYKRDYEVLQALVLLAACVFIASSLAVDVLYGVIDPRLRVRGREL
jgi:peptide/nickel transport system permease protein